MKIVVLDGGTLSDCSWEAMQSLGELVLHDHTLEADISGRARDATVILTNKVPIRAELIAQCPQLRFISVLATGFDCVDLKATRQRNIPVSNVPEYGTDSVAQFVFAQLLTLCHHIELHVAAVKAGEWGRSPHFSFWKTPLIELVGKTMGIVGFGRIGRRVGELAHAFGMKVLAYDAYPSAAPAYQPFAWTDMDTVFAQSDVISIHCPLTPETAGLVNRQRLQKVKPSAFLINAARGPLVVEEDLAEALRNGRLAGAALDVVAREPIRADNPLLTAPNCLITPHIAWATREARQRLLATAVANVSNFLAGKPSNVVN
jgi:glycerate dehydrogenase